MRWLRFLPLFIGVIFILGMMLWLVDALSRLYYVVALGSPFLANLLLLVLISLLVASIGVLVYYSRLFLRPRKQRRSRLLKLKAPKDKTEAAEATLQAVRRQLDTIQDTIARQALLNRSRQLEENLARKQFRVVVFGAGSAGKTSLVNALMGRIVGQVGAPMGTTTGGETYSLQLQGLNREIWLTDTPGILEAGIIGTEREQQARHLATEADLLLFVLDTDLRQSEFAPLKALVEIGKRSLVILNKTDRYAETDQAQLLARLRERLQGAVAPQDVVAVAANPAAVRLESGDIFQPEPDIFALIQRMAEVLRAEGADLIADNILLQSQRLGEEARQLIDAQRRRQADKIVERFQWIGAGVIAVTPLPGVDLLATAAVNAQMVVELGQAYSCDITLAEGRELALSLAKTLTSLGLVKGAMQLLSIGLQTNVATVLAGRAVQAVSAAYLTRIAGKSFIEYFRQNQDWGDGGMTEVVQRQFELNRRDEFIKVFVQEAIAKVVTPLVSESEREEEMRG
ncbi:MAG: GTP-binding protein [Pseudanabaenales cyanobacterium]|nr:GTP-binding protein [Pseudanabaenales cyanobacterium]